jgi:hypothetical protein
MKRRRAAAARRAGPPPRSQDEWPIRFYEWRLQALRPVAERRGRRARDGEAAKKGHPVSRRSRSRAGRSPPRSGARPGATTSSATATTRTACRAAAPTCATARWSTCRSRRRGDGARQRLEIYRRGDGRAVPKARWRRHLRRLRRRHRLAGRAAAGRFSEGRDGAPLRARRPACSPRPPRSVLVQLPRLGRRCASTSRPCCTASARASTRSRSCSSSAGRAGSHVGAAARADHHPGDGASGHDGTSATAAPPAAGRWPAACTHTPASGVPLIPASPPAARHVRRSAGTTTASGVIGRRADPAGRPLWPAGGRRSGILAGRCRRPGTGRSGRRTG